MVESQDKLHSQKTEIESLTSQTGSQSILIQKLEEDLEKMNSVQKSRRHSDFKSNTSNVRRHL